MSRRREYVLEQDGGGHAGGLVRLLQRHSDLDPALIDLFAEIVGRLQEVEAANGQLEARLQAVHALVRRLQAQQTGTVEPGWVVVRVRDGRLQFLGENDWVSELTEECRIEEEATAWRLVREPGETRVSWEIAQRLLADEQRGRVPRG